MRRAGSMIAVVALLLAGSARAEVNAQGNAEEMDPAALFKSGTEALAAGRPSEAIATLESLADRGVVDAVVSYDRGLAYAERVRAGAEHAGDLGRAAHGFEEARDLSHDPSLRADAATALAAVRSEIARRRSRLGESVQIEHGFSLGRTIVDVLSENAWAAIAVVMALGLSISIILRRMAQVRRAKVAATTAGAIAGSLLLITSGLAWAARDARLHLREGIVVVPSARLLNDRHLAMDGVAPIPEGVRVRVVEESAGFARVVLGGLEGYLPSGAVLPLMKP